MQALGEYINELKTQYRTRATRGTITNYSKIKVDHTGEPNRQAENAATILDKINAARDEYMQLYGIAIKLVLSIEDLTTGTLALDVLINQTTLATAGAKLKIRSKAEKQQRLDDAMDFMEKEYEAKFYREGEI